MARRSYRRPGSVGRVQRMGASELSTRLARGIDPDEVAADPLVAVTTPSVADREVLRDLAASLAGVPAVFVAVGVAPDDLLARELDAVAADDDELAAIAAAVASHPVASVALAMLLRGGLHRSIVEGLVAESTTYSTLQAGPDHHRWLRHRQRETAGRRALARSDEPAVLVRRDGDTLHLTLHRPAVHNAFDAAEREGLLDGLAVAAADSALRVVIDGDGPSFCSGGDLDEFGTLEDPASAHLIRLGRSAARAIARISDRVEVRVHGACAGAGVELPAFAGQVTAAPDTRFWLPELSLGLVPGAGGTVSLPRRIGRQRTALLALLGTPIDAPTALSWGLIDRIE